MIKRETREYVTAEIVSRPEGITLSELHLKVHRIVTRLQLRTMLDGLYARGEISRERVTCMNHRETRYYPHNGQPCVKRKNKRTTDNDGPMLSMKDFMPGRKYAAYIDF